ncbi:hypothetical protein [uncultured Tateyamaria sp.]|uniref:hypothetical protein n=1 Tax=uncultured Tateyamaria sp. TaxID=455651 RepID=UPI00261623DC|nr:hypothetical protein [uncultured Tateyamaria sp.]
MKFLQNLAWRVELWITRPIVLGLQQLMLFRIMTVAFPAFIVTFFTFVTLDVLLFDADRVNLRIWVNAVYSLFWFTFGAWLFVIAVRNFSVKGAADAQLRVTTLEKKLKIR